MKSCTIENTHANTKVQNRKKILTILNKNQILKLECSINIIRLKRKRQSFKKLISQPNIINPGRITKIYEEKKKRK